MIAITERTIQVEKKLGIAEIIQEKLSVLKFLLTEFSEENWQNIPRLRELSGFSDVQTRRLPSNRYVARLMMSAMRVFQTRVRSKDIASHRSAPVNRQQAEFFQSLDISDADGAETKKTTSETPLMVSAQIFDAEGHGRVVDSSRSKSKYNRTLDEMTNPFNPRGPRVFQTEYAQLVNLAARLVKREVGLTSADVFKLTLLATFQLSPGLKSMNCRYAQKVRDIVGSPELITGKRFSNELELLKDINFFWQVPLTMERISDKDFVRAIKVKDIIANGLEWVVPSILLTPIVLFR